MSFSFAGRYALRAVALGGAGIAAGIATLTGKYKHEKPTSLPVLTDEVPSRTIQMASLRGSSSSSPFDIVVIGGGATGSGVALDAATRGLRVALIEKEDFSSGTSSKSTKLVHGGVRYLEKAFFQADMGQLRLVYTALHERAILMKNAPHLTAELPTVTPCYTWQELPYYWSGLKTYDALAGRSVLQISRICTASEAKMLFPPLATTLPDGHTLKGAVVYYDGQMDDSRLNVALATTAARAGATVANHVEVVDLKKDSVTGRVEGVRARDKLTGTLLDVSAKVVVNATGASCDNFRQLSEPTSEPTMVPSSGSHIVLPDYFSAPSAGLIIPKTEDGRVLFLLPWQGKTIAGTTDLPAGNAANPVPSSDEIDLILDGIRKYLSIELSREDISSVWSGIRPLMKDPKADSTSGISRDHVVSVDEHGLVSIGGGKWTTYRSMAEDVVDTAVRVGGLGPVTECVTEHVKLTGSDFYDPNLFVQLTKLYVNSGAGLVPVDSALARHLASAYGDKAFEVIKLAQMKGLGNRISPKFPVLEAEVIFSARQEYCETAADFIARRSRIAFLDASAGLDALARVVDLLSREHQWSWSRQRFEYRSARSFLLTFKENGKE